MDRQSSDRRWMSSWLLPPLLAALCGAGAACAADEQPRLAANSFLFARYASVNSNTLYCGVGLGPAGLFVGFAQNPRSGFQERVAGAMTTVVSLERFVTLGLAMADASDGRFAQLYVLPGFSRSALTIEGTLVWSEPLGSGGTRQLDVNPVIALWRLGDHVSVGASYVGRFSDGNPWRQRGGPIVRLTVLRQRIDVELLSAQNRSRRELRVGFRAGL